MTRLSLCLALGLSSFYGFSQDSITTGYIQFKEVIDLSDMPFRRRGADVPEQHIQHWDLYFTPNESYCEFRPEDEDDGFSTNGGNVRFFRWEPKDVYYCDFNANTSIQYTEFMQKPFLISDSLNMDGWKLTGKQGIVQGYPCIEAKSLVLDSVEVLAWFTPRIRVKTGPQEFTGLPGAVLFAEYDKGKRVISAEIIQMGRLIKEEDKPEIPERGEEVTREEYQRIVAEKLEERKRLYGR